MPEAEASIALSPGDRLGPYEIVEWLGAGGMGEVYRARDARLRRAVAIKVVRSSLATPEYVKRLHREARAAGSLNHPNILAVFDIGTEGGIPYIVSELLEGESLRLRMDRGPIPFRKALGYGIQIAQALAAAHEKGIFHRDVTPGNVFLTLDGRVKLLDFGLARTEPVVDEDDTTASVASEGGRALGTVGYMSPEQVLGQVVDGRTDIFALGAVLYETLTGKRAFQRASPIETQNAVLKEEPSDPLDLNPALPPALAVAVRRCLEKNREERFQSARDLAFHLQQVEAQIVGPARRSPTLSATRRALVVAAGVLVAAVGGATLALMMWGPLAAPTFQQLTYRRSRISGARFSSDGILYSQALGGAPPQVWRIAPDSPESSALGHSADVLAARPGKLALSLRRRFVGGERFVGTLAEVAMGGSPRDILEDVEDADWNADGSEFAVVRSTGVGAPSRLEYPMGHPLYETSGALLSPRVSPDGQRVAFLEDLGGVGNRGRLVVVHRDRRSKVLTGDWANFRGLAWSPGGKEIWFTAGEARSNRSLRAVDLEGTERVVLNGPGSLTIWDVASDGRVLLTRDDERRVLMGVAPGETAERDFSWFDATGLASLSADGRFVVFGDRFGTYLRRTDGAPPVKLPSNDAYADDLSPDGRLVLATTSSADQLILVPTGPGSPRTLPNSGITSYSGSRWFPDGRRILFNGRDATHKLRAYVMEVGGGPPRALTPEGTWALSISPDGTLAAAISTGQGITLWPTGGGPSRPVAGSRPGDRPIGWTSDGSALWIFRRDEVPTHIHRLEIATGNRVLWKRLAPTDPDGLYSINEVQITPSGREYFYSYRRVLSQLYVVRGLH